MRFTQVIWIGLHPKTLFLQYNRMFVDRQMQIGHRFLSRNPNLRTSPRTSCRQELVVFFNKLTDI